MNEFWNQQPNENYNDWKYRLIFSKAQGLIDMTWNELAKFLGLNYNGETLRKEGKGLLAYRNYMIQNRDDVEVTDPKIINSLRKLETEKIATEKERMKLQDQKRAYRADIREQARSEKIEEQMMKCIDEAKYNASKYIVIDANQVEPTNREGVLLLSDWHKGQVSNNHWNVFNDVVFKNRIEKLLKKTIQYGQENKISTLNIFVLGDMVNGLIHVTTRINNGENVIDQTISAAQAMVEMIDGLTAVFPKIKVWFSRGNHDRITPKIRESIDKESFFDFFATFVERSFREPGSDQVEFFHNDFDDEIIQATICGKKILAVHGHKDKPKSIYKNLSTFTRTVPDYIFAGHYHSAAELEENGGEVVINGSLCGTDDFAIKLRRHAKPSQKLMIFEPEVGRICTYNIILD